MNRIPQGSLIHLCSTAALILLMAGCSTSTVQPTQQPMQLSTREDAIYQEALLNMKAGDTTKASTAFKQLTESHPHLIGPWINLASVYYDSKKYDEANSALNKAKAINGNLPEIYNLSGLLAVEKGEYQAAEKNYLAALALNKDYAVAHYNLALVYDNFYQDIDKAIAHYEQYLSLSGSNDKSTITWVGELKTKLKRKGS